MTSCHRIFCGDRKFSTVFAAAMLGCLATETKAMPDLTINQVDASGVTGDWQNLTISGQVAVTVENIGGTPVNSSFRVNVFEDATGNGILDAGETVFGQKNVSSLAAGGLVTVNVSVAGTVLFRNNLIHAFVDSNDQVNESDETNNYWNTGVSCATDPPVGTLDVVPEWSWTSSTTLPLSTNVIMTPAVMDVTDGNGNGPDGIPDVIFVSTDHDGGAAGQPGELRVVRGTDGAEMYTVTGLVDDVALTHVNSLAVGDLDGDGNPDIVGNGFPRDRLKAFVGATGALMWTSDPLSNDFFLGGVSIADLDGDGVPEVLAGVHAINGSSGALVWTGTHPPGGSPIDNWAVAYAADLDLDGFPEVIFGNSVYYGQTNPPSWVGGQVKAQVPALPFNSMSAVGNFDADPEAEIVFVGGGHVWLREPNLDPIWGPVAISTTGVTPQRGGSPTIADFDGDGLPEIGVAGSDRYTVFDTDGTVLWREEVDDSTSGITGSSVFDFDCNGTAEVVYGDENSLWVFSGNDGTVQLKITKSSGTATEYPLVADVDGDGHAEIIAPANTNFVGGAQRGIFVWGALDNNWAPTREVWNQHAYSITNINDDGTIPAAAQDNWLFPPGLPHNNFRQNAQSSCSAGSQPDLTASLVSCDASTGTVSARIGNGGAAAADPGVPVSFYDADPMSGGTWLASTVTSVVLAPGTWEDVSVMLTLTPGSSSVFVVADDTGNLDSLDLVDGITIECDETNNVGGGIDVCLGCATPPADMVAWWPLDEDPTGTTSTREILFGQNGTVVGFVSARPNEYVGNSMEFMGVGHVQVPNHSRLNFTTGDLSIDAWIRPCAALPRDGGERGIATIDPIVDKRGIGSLGEIAGYRLYLFNNRLALTLADPINPGQTDFISTGDPLPDCTWTHVTATVDRDMSVVLYVNGDVVGQFIPTGKQGSLGNGGSLLIGRGHPIAGPAATFFGAIDEVEIFRRAITQQEVRRIYDAGMGGKCKKSCSISSAASCCGASSQVTVSLCNDSLQTCQMKWEPSAGCNPTNFDGINILPLSAYPPTGDPAYDPRSVAPGECQSICVPLDCTALGAGPITWVYGMRTLFEDPDNPGEFIALCTDCGSLSVPAPCNSPIFCSMCVSYAGCGTFGDVGVQAGTPFNFAITNPDTTDWNVDYSFAADPANSNGLAVVSLDGLPPGTQVAGSVFVPAGQTVPVSVTAAFEMHDPFVAHDVAILLNLDDDGTLEPAASGGFRSQAPPLPLPCSDFDGDGDVDLADFAQFTLCFAGQGNPPAASCPASIDADCDADNDVDADDYAIVVQSLAGSF